LVWLIDPERRLARVYRHDGSESTITDDGQLDGEPRTPSWEMMHQLRRAELARRSSS